MSSLNKREIEQFSGSSLPQFGNKRLEMCLADTASCTDIFVLSSWDSLFVPQMKYLKWPGKRGDGCIFTETSITVEACACYCWWAGRQPQNDADDSINPRELGRGIDFEPCHRQRKTSRCLPLDQPFSQWYPATDLKNDEESMQNIFKSKLKPRKNIKKILRILVGTLLAKKKKIHKGTNRLGLMNKMCWRPDYWTLRGSWECGKRDRLKKISKKWSESHRRRTTPDQYFSSNSKPRPRSLIN